MHQLDLFDQTKALVHRDDPRSSHEALDEHTVSGKRQTHCDIVEAADCEPGAVEDDICRNYHRGAPTSMAAFKANLPSIKSLRGRVYWRIHAAGPAGMTCQELEQSLWSSTAGDAKHQSVSPRITELRRDGLVRVAGKRPQGRSEVNVYVVVEREA